MTVAVVEKERPGGAVEVVRTVCGRCHNACSMEVTVRDGRIVRIRGVKSDPRTAGSLCAKGLAGAQYVESPARLLRPVRRSGPRGSGKWAETSWDEALEEIAGALLRIREEHGPRAVVFGRGQAAGWGFPYDLLQRLAHAFGTEPGLGASECFVPRAVAEGITYGGLPMVADYPRTRLILIWGRQPTFSSAPTQHLLFEARERGARIVAIDPLHFHASARADEWLPIEPGTDLALALAMLHVVVEENLWDREFVERWTNDPGLRQLRAHLQGENRLGVAYTPAWAATVTGIPADRIRSLAREYATTPQACILTGHGLEGRTNVFQTSRAIAILRAITGHLNREGCDFQVPLGPPRAREFYLNSRVTGRPDEGAEPVLAFGVPEYVPPDVQFPFLFMGQGLLPTPDVLRWIDEGKVRALVMQAGNPLVMLPQPADVLRTLEKLDLLVVIDLRLSETAAVADWVLPAASYLERTEPEWFRWDYGLPIVRLRRKVVQVGEARSDAEILVALGRKLGLEEAFPTDDIGWYIDELLKPSGITLQKLEEAPEGIPFGPTRLSAELYEGRPLPTPDGRVHIVSELLAEHGFDALPNWEESAESPRTAVAAEYPLVLFTGRAGPMFVHCQLREIPWLRELRPEPRALIHPETAEAYGLSDGDEAVIESPRGSIRMRVEVTRKLRPGQVYVPGGWASANYNELGIADAVDPISSQANYMTCMGRIRKVEAAPSQPGRGAHGGRG